ncbi:MAG: hydrolase [Planctomycetaceae bacterium]|nr:hydrolase [Planctomycetaceae bacterium]
MSESQAGPPRSFELLSRTASRLVVVDVQDKLLAHIPVSETLVENCRRLIRGATILGVPVSATEQYPGGLGPTTAVLAELLGEIPEKLRFSCVESLDWAENSPETRQPGQVVLCGIESHICVMQTALDLLSRGFRVYIPADAVASRHKSDWQIALRRLSDAGAVVLTTESVLFEWCEVAGTDEFREISRLVTGKDGP